MKRIYTLITGAFLCTQTTNAQIHLLQAYHEPTMTINNNMGGGKKYDTLNVMLPKSMGANQNWDFSAMALTTVVATNTYVSIGSAPHANQFPTATLAESLGSGNYNYYRSDTIAKTFEWLGAGGTNSAIATDGIIRYKWPITYNNSWTDSYATTMGTLAVTGKYMVTCTGYGTLKIPGGKTFSDALQIMTVDSASSTTGTLNTKTTTTTHMYFSAQNRYPILWVTYVHKVDSVTTKSAGAWVNWLEAVGLTESDLDASLGIYPNPATSSFAIRFGNNQSNSGSVTVLDLQGRVLRKAELSGNQNTAEIPVGDLPKGLYLVNIKLGDLQSSRRLILE